MLQLLLPRLRSGSVVIADNIPLAREDRGTGPTAEFTAHLADTGNGFLSSVVGFGKGGMSFSVYHPASAA